MSNIIVTTSNGAPTFSPALDPRINDGISFHYNTISGNVYIGISVSESPRWIILNRNETRAVSSNSDSYSPARGTIRVTTSNALPNFMPELDPLTEGLHFHVAYLPGDLYRFCIGVTKLVNNNNWSVYNASGTIA